MTKSIRESRTNINGSLPALGPTVQDRVVPEETYKAPGQTGLEGLGQAMSNFFGQLNGALGNIQQGVNIGERERIAQENKAQKSQAAQDFYSGKAMDKSLMGDLDYYDTYRSLLSVKTADGAAQDFQNYYINDWAPQNPTGDLSTARDDWVKQNLAGSNDADFSAQTLAQFYKSTDQMVAAHQETAVKNQIAEGKQTLSAAIDADVRGGTFNPNRLAYYIEAYKSVDPLNPYEAAPYVAGELSNAARNHPDKGMTVLSALGRPGTGVNGKSFAESFPDAYSKLNSDVVQNWTAVKSQEQWNVLDDLRQRSDNFKTASDDELKKWVTDLTATVSQYGSPPIVGAMRHDYAEELQRRAIDGAGVAQTKQMLYQDLPKDASVIKKYLPSVLHQQGVDNILKGDPQAVSDVLVRAGGVVPEDYKVQLSSALTSFENPASQEAAAKLLVQITQKRDLKFADSFLSDDASRYLHHIVAEQSATDEPIGTSIARANEIRRQGKALSWDEVIKVGQGEKASDKVNSAVDASVAKAVKATSWVPFAGYSITIPPDVRQTISDYALNVVEERGKQGVDWQSAVDEAVARIGSRGEVRPANGSYIFSLNTDHPSSWEAADGKIHNRPRLGFEEFNPTTGKTVNTVQVYERQLTALGQKYQPLLPNGSTSGVSLGDNPYASAVGAYSVVQDGNPIIYLPGEPIKFQVRDTSVSGPMGVMRSQAPTFKEVPFPADPKNSPVLAGLPEGFGFVPQPLANGQTGWVLSYRPTFGDQAGQTLEQRARAYSPPPAPTPTPDAPPSAQTDTSQTGAAQGPAMPGLGGSDPTDPLSQTPGHELDAIHQQTFNDIVALIKAKKLPPDQEASAIETVHKNLFGDQPTGKTRSVVPTESAPLNQPGSIQLPPPLPQYPDSAFSKSVIKKKRPEPTPKTPVAILGVRG